MKPNRIEDRIREAKSNAIRMGGKAVTMIHRGIPRAQYMAKVAAREAIYYLENKNQLQD